MFATKRSKSLSAAAEEDHKSDGYIITDTKYLFLFVG